MDKPIDKNINIEELIAILPASVSYLSKKGIKCIACGEPIWGTLEEAALEKGFKQEEIEKVIAELNALSKE